jgi:phospholipid-binding lipoprotein MlaA
MTRTSSPSVPGVGALLAALVTLSACATADLPEGQLIADPFEETNRAIFAFNAGVDRTVISPVASVYETITPRFFRTGVSNFLGNLDEPVNFANAVLQGKPSRAAGTFGRFAVNSTLGIGGLFDPATGFGLEENEEDFGQTLAVWGVDSGPFLVLPLLGPTSARDFLGGGVDRAFDPLTHVRWQADYLGNDEDFDTAFRISTGVLGVLNTRVALDAQLEALNGQPEPYVALRRAWAGARAAAIRDGEAARDAFEDLPDYDTDLETDASDTQP